MDNPRPEKVAVVDEVRARLSESQAALVTEYRGINVADMAKLRRALREAGGQYGIYKNTLVRFAARDLGLDLDELLTGPTAIAFVPKDGGDAVTTAKALKVFAKDNPNLVIKGGILGDRLLSAADASALADVAPREELLARLAGGMAAPMVQFAGLLQALPRNFAYGLKALIEQQGGVPDVAAAPEADEAPAAADTAEPSTTTDEASTDAPSTDEAAPAADLEAADPSAAEPTEATDTNDSSADAEATPTEES